MKTIYLKVKNHFRAPTRSRFKVADFRWSVQLQRAEKSVSRAISIKFWLFFVVLNSNLLQIQRCKLLLDSVQLRQKVHFRTDIFKNLLIVGLYLTFHNKLIAPSDSAIDWKPPAISSMFV